MSTGYLDANVLLRFLTGDDLAMQARARALLERVQRGEVALTVPESAIADVVFVLASPRLYHLPRARIQAILAPLLQLPNLRVDNRAQLLAALDHYVRFAGLNFGDCLIVAHMEHAGEPNLYTFDQGFDRVPGLNRHEPPPPPERPAAE